MDIPFLTTAQMVEVDRIMIEDMGILLIQMMELAGLRLAELARRRLGGQVSDRRIAVLCAGGNNGGGGMVAARHLHNWGAKVHVSLTADSTRLKDVPAHQWRILQAIGLTGGSAPDLAKFDLILDALIGYGIRGEPQGQVADWIEKANQSMRPVLALDVPSGLDATTGISGGSCIRAIATLTLALPKTGLREIIARPFVGDLYLADIGVPPEVYRQLGLEVQLPFIEGNIVKIG
jgi:NAD(P)H-hydrate epimerase